MGYYNRKIKRLFENLDTLHSLNLPRQFFIFKEENCDTENVPFFFDILIDLAEWLFYQIQIIQKLPRNETPSSSVANSANKKNAKNHEKRYASYQNISKQMGESIFDYFSTESLEEKEAFLRRVCSCKHLLNHGRKKIEESIDLENWSIGEPEISLSNCKLHIATSFLPELGDSVEKISEKVPLARYQVMLHTKLLSILVISKNGLL